MPFYSSAKLLLALFPTIINTLSLTKLISSYYGLLMSLKLKLTLLLSSLFLVLLLNTSIVFYLDQEGRSKLYAVTRTHLIIDESELLYNDVISAETGQRGYLLTHDASYLAPYYSGIKESQSRLSELNSLTVNNKKQQQQLSDIRLLVDQKFTELALTIELAQQNTDASIKKAISVVQSDQGKIIMDQISEKISTFQDDERQRLDIERKEFRHNRKVITFIVSIQIPLFILLSVLCAVYIRNKLFKPLNLLITNTEKLERGEKPDTTHYTAHDEIGHLLKRFYRMSKIIHKKTAKLIFQANHDHLTGLLNRTELESQLIDAINLCTEDSKVAVIFIDINKFKELNDHYGHAVGDDILKETAKRISSSTRADDDIYRYGGDEFIVIMHNTAKTSYVEAMIAHLIAQFKLPFEVANQRIEISLSIGVSIAPDHSCDALQLIKNADTAMYKAKTTANKTYFFYQSNDEN